MTVTLDDVSNLLHLSIEGRMMDHDAKVDRDHEITLMTRLLGMSDSVARSASKTKYGAHISYPALKRLYEEHLTEARRLEDPQTMEWPVERDRRRHWYVRSFLLYLIGSALFTNKTNGHINVIYLDCMVDLNAIGKWSWVGMNLAYMYDYLNDFVRLCNKTMAGYSYPSKSNKIWKAHMPCAGRWLTRRGQTTVHHYHRLLDRIWVDDAKWSTYHDHRAVRHFQIICTYSRWLICGKERVYRHLPKRVKRQFGYMQDIPKHPSDVPEILVDMMANVFKEPRPWCYSDWEERYEKA
ncbi:protein MAIN-LIKE 1-like [Medicago truncatula]|uniref:protein MAIN-LIKE 1-like n=1 Tax=Medicago truncatula TaxID=3880 RepID=UPI000D2F24C0|nr:protein MAIN-LIKE 1-like [Medicago truncatula]